MHLPLALVALTMAIGAAALWPFSFFPRNGVRWLPNEPGLEFDPPGVVWSAGDVSFARSTKEQPACAVFTIEIRLRPTSTPDRSLRWLLTIDRGPHRAPLKLGQWKSTLLLRPPHEDSPAKRREIGIASNLSPHKPCVITVTGDAAGIRTYVDGTLARTYPKRMLLPETLRGRLILGDSGCASTGNDPWKGDLFGLALYDQALSSDQIAKNAKIWAEGAGNRIATDDGLRGLYLFDEGDGRTVADALGRLPPLEIPSTYRVLRREYLVADWSHPALVLTNGRDMVLNILGFIPWGFLCAVVARRALTPWGRTTLLAVAGGAVLSLTIETIQVFLPARDSSLTDVLTNTLGTTIGVALAPMFCLFPGRWWRSNRCPKIHS